MEIIVPLIVVLFIVIGIVKKVGVFDAFLTGAKEGLCTAYMIAPTLVGLITAVTMLRSSGAVDMLTELVTPLAEKLGFPAEIVPVAVLRPVSGGGSTALLIGIFEKFGPDSFAGKVVSVMAGSTETTFYAIAVYYGSVGIKKTRHTLFSGLCADFTAVVFSVLTVRLFMR
ncbi:MAG: spore maturation protein [Ruminococcaceae bacterium]|nr:spore maturation protein [Oscillospiraceae bacterium]